MGRWQILCLTGLALFAIFVTQTLAANPWGIDESKYTIPAPRNKKWDLVRDEFGGCEFGYGVTYRGYFEEWWKTSTNKFPFDYITIWLGDTTADWNEWWIGQAVSIAIHFNKPLVIYAYVIAESAKGNLNISDCDQDPVENLCHKGSKWLKENWESNIIPQYKLAGEKIAEYINEYNNDQVNAAKKFTRSIIWSMEPDYQQYRDAPDTVQSDGGVPAATLAGKYYMEMISTIAKYQTAAPNRFLTDISPWLNDEFKGWMELYPSDYVDGFYGGLNAKSDMVKDHSYNNVSYTMVNALYGGNTRPIMAQGGWGVGGADTDTYKQWLVASDVVKRMDKHVLCASFSNDNPQVIINAMEAAAETDTNTACYWKNINPDEDGDGDGEESTKDGSSSATISFITIAIVSIAAAIIF